MKEAVFTDMQDMISMWMAHFNQAAFVLTWCGNHYMAAPKKFVPDFCSLVDVVHTYRGSQWETMVYSSAPYGCLRQSYVVHDSDDVAQALTRVPAPDQGQPEPKLLLERFPHTSLLVACMLDGDQCFGALRSMCKCLSTLGDEGGMGTTYLAKYGQLQTELLERYANELGFIGQK